MVNPTQLSDKEFTAWMERLVEARRNRQENRQRPYSQFRKPFLQRRSETEKTQQQQELKQKLKPAEELNTEELITHMRCEYADIEEAVEMYNLDVEECRSARLEKQYNPTQYLMTLEPPKEVCMINNIQKRVQHFQSPSKMHRSQ